MSDDRLRFCLTALMIATGSISYLSLYVGDLQRHVDFAVVTLVLWIASIACEALNRK